MKTEFDIQLFGQRAIDFAKHNERDLYALTYRGELPSSRVITLEEAQEMLAEGIESFWCWTDEEPPMDDEPPSFTPEEFYENNQGYQSCSCEDYPCCGH